MISWSISHNIYLKPGLFYGFFNSSWDFWRWCGFLLVFFLFLIFFFFYWHEKIWEFNCSWILETVRLQAWKAEGREGRLSQQSMDRKGAVILRCSVCTCFMRSVPGAAAADNNWAVWLMKATWIRLLKRAKGGRLKNSDICVSPTFSLSASIICMAEREREKKKDGEERTVVFILTELAELYLYAGRCRGKAELSVFMELFWHCGCFHCGYMGTCVESRRISLVGSWFVVICMFCWRAEMDTSHLQFWWGKCVR